MFDRQLDVVQADQISSQLINFISHVLGVTYVLILYTTDKNKPFRDNDFPWERVPFVNHTLKEVGQEQR